MAEYTRAGGARLILERQLGEGGEGAVWTIQDEPELCAKIWRQPTPASVDKLSEILGLYTTDRAEIAAWPREMVRGADGEACGEEPRLPPVAAAVGGDDQAALALAGVGILALGFAQGRVVAVALHACMAARRSEAGGWE
jgi:hypothetical protein